MFLSKSKKNNVYPCTCKPQFYYLKVGSKGIKIIKAYFSDESHIFDSTFSDAEALVLF